MDLSGIKNAYDVAMVSPGVKIPKAGGTDKDSARKKIRGAGYQTNENEGKANKKKGSAMAGTADGGEINGS